MKISGFIITKNEEKLISKAIKSIEKICDEIIVIDSGSTDKTAEIAKNLGVVVVENSWPGYLKQKVYGESLCKNNIVLNIDADEELSIELQEEILEIKNNGNSNGNLLLERYKGFSINFVIMLKNDIKPRFLAPSNRFIRLYDKRYINFAHTDSSYTTKDAVSKTDPNYEIYDLKNYCCHRSSMDITKLIEKSNFYSSEQAKDMVKNKRKIRKTRIFCEFFVCFFKSFFIRRYFVFGFDGFLYSMIFGFRRFLRLAKAYEFYDNQNESK